MMPSSLCRSWSFFSLVMVTGWHAWMLPMIELLSRAKSFWKIQKIWSFHLAHVCLHTSFASFSLSPSSLKILASSFHPLHNLQRMTLWPKQKVSYPVLIMSLANVLFKYESSDYFFFLGEKHPALLLEY